MLTVPLPADFPPQVVSVSPMDQDIPTAGDSSYTLRCTVTHRETLNPQTVLEVTWLDTDSNTISSDTDFTLSGESSTTATTLTSTLTISTVRTSHAGMYHCLANMTIPNTVVDHQVQASTPVRVRSESSPATMLSVLW